MESKILKTAISSLIIATMVMSVFSFQALNSKNEVQAATAPPEFNNCYATISPGLAVNKTSKITLYGYNVSGADRTKPQIIPNTMKIEAPYYYPSTSYKRFYNAPYSVNTTVNYPDNYLVTAKFEYYKWSGSRWSHQGDLEKTYRYNIRPRLTLNANKGKISKKSSITNTYNMNSSLGNLPKPTRKGFKFTGWYESKSGYTTEKCGGTYKKIVKDLGYKSTTTKAVYAQWSKKVKVKFNARGGKLKKKSKKVTYISNKNKKSYGSLPTPKKRGKYFKGWYTKKKGGTRISKYSNVSKSKNHTLYAQWY